MSGLTTPSAAALEERGPIGAAPRRVKVRERGFKLLLWLCLATCALLLGTLLVDIGVNGIGQLSASFITDYSSYVAANAGVRAALWDDVKDRLKDNAFGMSGGQQQRLCIARALATGPDVILMDEPCSALDPISTGKIEDLMMELRESYSIVIVTHNMQQAARVSDMTAFFTVELEGGDTHRIGRVVEFDETERIFTNPSDERTEAYVTGKVG